METDNLKSRAVAVIGAGSWGTTLALLLDGKGIDTRLWEFYPEQAERLRADRENVRFLPGIPIPGSLKVTSSIDEAIRGATHLLFVTPSHTMRQVARAADAPLLDGPDLLRDEPAAPTAFVKWGQAHAAGMALDGLGMLVEQAAESFRLWRGVAPDTAPVIESLRRSP